jgi:protein-S-isoprenylcysteine O-methyltransferase Ste14
MFTLKRVLIYSEKQPREASLKYFYAVLGWSVWCTLHSALISITVTEYMKGRLGDRFRYYRLSYNIVSLATLLPLVSYSLSIQGESIFRWEGSLAIVKYLLLATCLLLFIAGGRHYSMFQFLGIRQIRAGQLDRALSGQGTFIASGVHRMTRHPWYLGGMMIVWARDLSLSTILNNVVITSYFIIGSILEERKLVREFGEQYREYQRNVPMVFPFKWLRKKITGATRRFLNLSRLLSFA